VDAQEPNSRQMADELMTQPSPKHIRPA